MQGIYSDIAARRRTTAHECGNLAIVGVTIFRGTYGADCVRPSIRELTSLNSVTSASVLLPATVAASISVPNRMTVAMSALHERQNFSVLPGSSKSSVIQPQTLQRPLKACSVISILNDLPFPLALIPVLRRVSSRLGSYGLPNTIEIVRNGASESPDGFIRKP